ncbi:hydroxymethylglutaryl-CoA lyase [Sporosarcina thermotolerans]|uniref:Hydroxymethylglutaryl-CoA lyase n=1 Tax=Sporosarcina thermotolerans TaxID=633404 RepID=A0AAW9ABW0_9BACL|nr:hydroxymethylglutaryl-CoA lyase [Sporosarcina thermotolerans]MDW0117694.1 hydroxymethylglutaryl-CoA lyase [Sporosarcina thermotolerans]
MGEVTIIDVSPRDGLQIEPELVSTEQKLKLINMLADAGIHKVEVTSFVHPLKVPQMADASDVLQAIADRKGLETTALIPNLKGYERAKDHSLSEVNWVSAATETFNAKNIGMSIEDNMSQFLIVLDEAKRDGIKTCFSVAVSFGCPYEGDVDEEKVLQIVRRVKEAGVDRIGIADTIGIATPDHVERLMKRVLDIAGDTPVAIHLHDTRGLGLANAYMAYRAGVRIFETSASGIGGCPFAPGAAGNLATEDLVYLFERMNIPTGVDFRKLLGAADYAASLSTKNPLGRIRHVEKQREKGKTV